MFSEPILIYFLRLRISIWSIEENYFSSVSIFLEDTFYIELSSSTFSEYESFFEGIFFILTSLAYLFEFLESFIECDSKLFSLGVFWYSFCKTLTLSEKYDLILDFLYI